VLEEIINKNLNRIEKDLLEINDLQRIDFLDIFPKSEEHRNLLDEEISKIAMLLEKTERGNVYALNNPIETRYGKELTEEEVHKIIWEKIKEVNKQLTSYKAIKNLEIKHDEFEKTTTMKIKRYAELKKDE